MFSISHLRALSLDTLTLDISNSTEHKNTRTLLYLQGLEEHKPHEMLKKKKTPLLLQSEKKKIIENNQEDF